jgi:hypothetical protein
MRRAALVIAILGATLFASGAEAASLEPLTANAQALSLDGGHGLAIIALRGSVLGTLRHGRLIVKIPRRSRAVAYVYGAESKRKLSARRTLYRGYRLRYRVFGGAWRLRIEGRGIDAGAAGRGWFGLQGTRGTYSIGGGAYRLWPRVYKTFTLGT